MFEEERINEILKVIYDRTKPESIQLDGFLMKKTEDTGKVDPKDVFGKWDKVSSDTIWGGHNEYYEFRKVISIPEKFSGKTVEFCLFTGMEGAWDATNPQFSVYVDGILRQGFDTNHNSLILSQNAKEGTKYEIFLSAFTGVSNFHLSFKPFLNVIDKKVLEYYYDLKTLYDAAVTMEKDEESYFAIMPSLTESVNMLDLRECKSYEFYKSLERADKILKDRFYSDINEKAPNVMCVGATHIDIAWLWTIRVTRDKAVRSFSTALELMDRYPDFTFMSSQPQLYKYVKEDAPEIYEKIKERVKEGRWEIEGGMFLEPDCNIPSGESFIRQILYGKKIIKEEFGKDSKVLWLPDVFGYSAALPQILKKCGIDYFMTTKISWNEVNKMPADTFYWKGIDGTKILTHFITTRDYVSKTRDTKTSNEFCTEFSTNYNGYINPSEIRGAWQRYQQKDISKDILCSYGYGDGGGGATREMIETKRRLKYGIPGCPRVSDTNSLEFFKKLQKNIEGKDVPVWSGELYLEYHRGTYTSAAKNKKNNRKGEFALLNAETLSILSEMDYPKRELDEGWEILLRNQFHDILPGSAIKEVYEDSDREYRRLFEITDKIKRDAYKRLSEKNESFAINMCGFTASDIAYVVSDMVPPAAQKTEDGKYIIYAENVPSKGFSSFLPKEAEGKVSVSLDGIETPFVKLLFNEKGQIKSFYDKEAEREILMPGKLGNALIAYEDRPHKYDNWNIFDYYKEKAYPLDTLISSEVVEAGPVRYAVKFGYKYFDSLVFIIYYAYPFKKRIDIKFSADWKTHKTLLKAHFPVDINTDEATFEIQYGNVTRKTHKNTSWDKAKFETNMHKWLDVSEGNFGVSFLNDCKYGVGIDENNVGITLIKSGTYPNENSDIGYHEAIYSIYSHKGTWKDADTASESYLLNNPMEYWYSGNENGFATSLITCDAKNVMVEAVKKAESGNSFVFRIYEFMNERTIVNINFPRKMKKICLLDPMENMVKCIGENTDKAKINIKPFDIETILVECGN